MFYSLQVKNLRSIEDSGPLPLGPITVIVGRNNAGKSTLLRAIGVVQENLDLFYSDVRVGAQSAEILLGFMDLPMKDGGGNLIGNRFGSPSVLGATISSAGPTDRANRGTISLAATSIGGEDTVRVDRAPSSEPGNVIYPIFSARLPTSYQQQTNSTIGRAVHASDNNIVARVRRLAGLDVPEAIRFRSMCKDILGLNFDVVDTPESSVQQLGVAIDLDRYIPVEAMGAGIATTLSLLVTLSVAKGRVILIEEPENDLHPAALKKLLEEVKRSSQDNQFVITTHSSVVLTRLGAVADTTVLHVTRGESFPPKSEVRVVASSEERLEVLSDLGYELPDLALQEGWMIFEESSAERLIRQYLSKWFAPGLLRLTFIGARGDSRVKPLMLSYREMLLFSHLSEVYRGRAWVFLDAGPVGSNIVQDLRKTFKDWPADHFQQWDEREFERYYPEDFADAVERALSEQDKKLKKELKEALLKQVLHWIEEDEDRAREAFQSSAAEVIAKLRAVESEVLELRLKPPVVSGRPAEGGGDATS
ncbi:ATP-dependent endonuclease [Actinoplanes sp. NPDC049265]|uniref:ATP-dependent nuclease n=1 Tax=Actinoplanes sp. NPDC049265 TaxID=3363902 RepID=UPI0037140D2D